MKRLLISLSVFSLILASPQLISAADDALTRDSAPKSIDVYSELARTSSVRVSPNGNYVAIVSPYKGNKAIFIYNLNDSNAKPKVIPSPRNSIIKGVQWASNKHLLTEGQSRHFYPFGKLRKHAVLHYRWYSTNIENNKTVLLMRDEIEKKSQSYQVVDGGSLEHSLPDSPKHMVMALNEFTNRLVKRYYKVNLDTGKSNPTLAIPISTDRVIRSKDGNTILARSDYHSKSGKYRVYSGSHPNEKLLFEEVFDTDTNPTTFLLTMTGNKLVLAEEKNKNISLFTVDLKSGQKAPFDFDANVPSGYEYGPIFDNYTRDIIGFSYTDDLTRETYLKAPFDGWHKKASKALKGQNVNILSWTEDHSMVTLYAESKNDAGTYYLFEPAVGQISPLGGQYPELTSRDIAQTIRSDYTARDGLKVPAYLTLPPGKTKASGPMPLVVLAHGGPIARDDASFDFWAQYIASQGYAVFKPQFRGSTGFGYAHQRKGDGQFGEGMLHDTIDGVKALIKEGVVDAEKICVTGASYGGYQALALPMIEPDMFKCALSLNGVSDIPKMLDYEIARTGSLESGPVKFWNRVMGMELGGRDRLSLQSPADNAEKIKAEIVLMHGTDDGTVPIEQAELMASALKKSGKKTDIILLKKDDHNLSLASSRKKLLEVSDELFARHLQ